MAERLPRWIRGLAVVVLGLVVVAVQVAVMIGLFFVLNAWIFHIPLSDR